MKILSLLLMIATVVCAALGPYFIGHGIVAHGTWPWLTAGGLFLAAALFAFAYVKVADRVPEPETHGHH